MKYRNTKPMSVWKAVILPAILIIIVALAIGYAVKQVSCYARWSDSTMDYRIRYLSCQVKHPTLGWIPADQFRWDTSK